MHFSKTYSQILLTLPDELRNSAIEYRQLKKLINELVAELETLGLSPLVLQELLQRDGPENSTGNVSELASRGRAKGKERAHGERRSDVDSQGSLSDLLSSESYERSSSPARVVYELTDESETGDIVPRLRLWMGDSVDSVDSSSSHAQIRDMDDSSSSRSPSPAPGAENRKHAQENAIMPSHTRSRLRRNLLWSLQERSVNRSPDSWSYMADTEPTAEPMESESSEEGNQEVMIPLASDTAFFRLLTTALNSLSAALDASRDNLTSSIEVLSAAIGRTSRPASVKGKSDLYTWRAIFQLYVEAQVFESTSERDRGDRSIEDSETRLAQFARRVGGGGFSLTMSGSREALERFLEVNVTLMNLKKFQFANAEAARKILKKHAKRTALPLPTSATELIPALGLGKATASVSHVLIVALTETLMPVVPHIDDYLCLICTAIAFKPIRLRCGHLFCVRCLVKMQKAGQDNCPMCRAPTVTIADKSNVDYAMLNFMRDWFPKETREKSKANERESAQEEMEELGLDTRCIVS